MKKSILVVQSFLCTSLLAQDAAAPSGYYWNHQWQARPIVKVGDTAPQGGVIEKLGESYYLQSGSFVFWGRQKKERDWALYSFTDGQVKHVANAFEKITFPDNIEKTFLYSDRISDTDAYRPRASDKLLYLPVQSLSYSCIYSFDGQTMRTAVCEGDKVQLPGNREVVVRSVSLQGILNSNQALISFASSKPVTTGWLLHDETGVKPLFIFGDEIPGLPGVKFDHYSNVLTKAHDILIYGDTILAKLYFNSITANHPHRQLIMLFTKTGSEIIESGRTQESISLFDGGSAGNFFIDAGRSIYQYKDGQRIMILEDKKDLPGYKGHPQVSSAAWVEKPRPAVLFTVGLDVNTDSKLYLFQDNKVRPLDTGEKGHFRMAILRGLSGYVLANPYGYIMKPGEYVTTYVDPQSWEIKRSKLPPLKTTGAGQFYYFDLIYRSENKLIAKHGAVYPSAYFELTR